MKALISTVTVAVVLGFATGASASGACNSAGCWRMQVDQYKVSSGGIWVLFASSDEELLKLQGCTLKSVWFGGARKALFLNKLHPNFDELKEGVLISKLFGQPLGVGPFDDPSNSWTQCEIDSITLESNA